jgi:hypothetical protein
MTTFAIQTGASDIDKTGALNYVLNNVGQGLQVNNETGVINLPNSVPNTVPYAWAYQYLYIAFANSFDGNVDFSQSDYTNRTYIGFWNTPTQTLGGSQNPAQYVWYNISDGGFGTTKNLYYSVRSSYQVQFQVAETLVAPNFDSENLWRLYDPSQFFPAPGYVGLDLSWITNATNVGVDNTQGTISSLTPGSFYILDNDGPDWVPSDEIVVQSAETLFLNTVVPATTYYIAMGETVGDYSIFDADVQMTYQTGSTATSSILTAPNIQSNALVNILPQSSEPDGVVLGSITVADAVTWDPATASTTTPYVAFYNGVAWTKLG